MITFSWLGVKVCMLVTVGKLAAIGSGMDKLPHPYCDLRFVIASALCVAL